MSQFLPVRKMVFKIYSRLGCKYCKQIIQVMELSELKYVVYQLDRDFTNEDFDTEFGGGATFPQVVLEGIKLGGCQESIKYMREQAICCV